MSTILVTGIHGFVGNNLVNSLKEQHTLFGLDIVSPNRNGVLRTFGWNELKSIPKVETVIHLAGKAHDTKNSSDEKTYFDVNVGLTKKIFDFFLDSEAEKFIFFSSVKAVADKVEQESLNETSDPKPMTPYGRSKLEAEQYILSKSLPEGKFVYILRPCMIHGPGNKGNLNLLFSLAEKGWPWPLGSFENKRSFCSIDNLIYTVRELIEKHIKPGIYQVADDTPLSTNELIRLIADSLGLKSRIWKFSPNLIRLVAHIGDILRLPLNSERLKKLTESYVVSNQKLKSALGIERMPVPALEGMRKTIESFKADHKTH